MTKDQWISEVMKLWCDVVRVVYLKEATGAAEVAERGWEGVNMTPLSYVIFVANPHNLTNQVVRGQKAREKRWKKWLKDNSYQYAQGE